MPTEQEMDNLLVKQKDDIRQYINNGEYDKASSILLVVCSMWQACHYGYKYEELQALLRTRRDEWRGK